MRQYTAARLKMRQLHPNGEKQARKRHKAKIEPKTKPVVKISPRAFFCPFLFFRRGGMLVALSYETAGK